MFKYKFNLFPLKAPQHILLPIISYQLYELFRLTPQKVQEQKANGQAEDLLKGLEKYK